MGRSVDYLNNAQIKIFFPFDYEDNEFDNDLAWQDLKLNLSCEIRAKFKSYQEVREWEGNEVLIFLQNGLCNIALSEYCGLVSLSVAPRETEVSMYNNPLALRHCKQIEQGLQKIVNDLGLTRLNKIGTFSNGEAVFEKAK